MMRRATAMFALLATVNIGPRLKLLAVSSPKRMTELPDVPTIFELMPLEKDQAWLFDFHSTIEDLGRTAPVVAQLGGAVGDAQKACLAKHGWRAIGQLKVQAAAHRHHQVSLAHHGAAHGGHHTGVLITHQATALARVQVSRAREAEQLTQSLACALRTTP